MMALRPANSRGRTEFGWLKSRHTFSFADYYDPQQLSFRTLRVINDDHVAPASGFGTHPHRDMEILTYVLTGSVEHRDSTGGHGIIGPGELQVMSAGTGIQHSEVNPSPTVPLHLLQIWIVPERRGVTPRYEQRNVADGLHEPRLLASADGRATSLRLYQDVDVWAAKLLPEEEAVHPLRPGRAAWVHVAEGTLQLNDLPLEAGDGAAITDEAALRLKGGVGSHVLFFDLA